MKIIYGDLFNPATYKNEDGEYVVKTAKQYPDAICITTNGYVKKNGEAVMGKATALQAAKINNTLPKVLGGQLKRYGLYPHILSVPDYIEYDYFLVSFPVKHIGERYDPNKTEVVGHMKGKFKPGEVVPGWALKASMSVIINSAVFLEEIVNSLGWNRVVIPRPGCGAGELSWERVKLELENCLDERFYIIDRCTQ